MRRKEGKGIPGSISEGMRKEEGKGPVRWRREAQVLTGTCEGEGGGKEGKKEEGEGERRTGRERKEREREFQSQKKKNRRGGSVLPYACKKTKGTRSWYFPEKRVRKKKELFRF
jgi:hypothetical protein